LALVWSQAGLARDEEPGQVQHEDAFKKKWPKQAGDTLGFSEELGLGKTKTPILMDYRHQSPGVQWDMPQCSEKPRWLNWLQQLALSKNKITSTWQFRLISTGKKNHKPLDFGWIIYGVIYFQTHPIQVRFKCVGGFCCSSFLFQRDGKCSWLLL
jgi:hypothetical protein